MDNKLYWCRCPECYTNKLINIDENLTANRDDCFCDICKTCRPFNILREVTK